MIISVKRNFLELKNINDLIKKDKPEDNYSVKKTKPDFQLNKFFYKQIGKKYLESRERLGFPLVK